MTWAAEAVASDQPTPWSGGGAVGRVPAPAPPDIAHLFEYADAHRQVRRLEAFGRDLPAVPGAAIAARFSPAGRALRTTGNWYDVIPLDSGVGLVMGDVATNGLEAATEVAQLRATVRAFALLQGNSPGRVIELLDRLPATTGIGVASTLVYVGVDPHRGELSFSNAGHCPPLLLAPGRPPELLESARSGPLGITRDDRKPETTLRLTSGSTLVLFTRGLVANPRRPFREGLEQLRNAVVNGPRDVEELCEYVMDVCLPDKRETDASLLAMRFSGC